MVASIANTGIKYPKTNTACDTPKAPMLTKNSRQFFDASKAMLNTNKDSDNQPHKDVA